MTWNSVGEMSSELEAHEKALEQEINELRDKPLSTTAEDSHREFDELCELLDELL
jgi:hypothetical protein